MAPNLKWKTRAREIASERGLDSDYFDRLIAQESAGYEDDVITGRRISPAGALGIAQFMPATAVDMGVDPLDPEQALNGAARYLLRLAGFFEGDWTKATAAYNAGPGTVQKTVQANGANWRAALPAETITYLAIIQPELISNPTVPATTKPQKDFWDFAVSQGFGSTNEPLDSPYDGYPHFNKGLDFATPVGTVVRCIIAGTVVSRGPAERDDGWGNRVWIQDAQANTHNYGHLSVVDAAITVGKAVIAGSVLGASGSTGHSSGPHVSYDVWNAKGQFIDPSRFVWPEAPDQEVGPNGRTLRQVQGTDYLSFREQAWYLGRIGRGDLITLEIAAAAAAERTQSGEAPPAPMVEEVGPNGRTVRQVTGTEYLSFREQWWYLVKVGRADLVTPEIVKAAAAEVFHP